MAKEKQVGALPWRQGGDGVEVLLVTTRTTRRWVIPKGWPMADRADHDAAAQEALEEAGVTGHVSALPYGHFNYLKQSASGKTRMVRVAVYPLEVTGEQGQWPEQGERSRRWFTPAKAALAAGEPELALLLSKVADAGTAGPFQPHVVPSHASRSSPATAEAASSLWDLARRWLGF